jgi:uncharacterized protein
VDKVDIIHMGGLTGAGLYNIESVSAGEYILELPGEIMPMELVSGRFIRINRYFALQQPRKWTHDYYLNHSCDPNCYIDCHCGWPSLVARKRIKRDEEMTINYNAVWEYVPSFKCYCEAAICIGDVSGFNDLNRADKIFTKDDMTPYLLELFEDEQNGLY